MNIEIDRDAINVYSYRYDSIDEPALLDQYHNLLSQAELQRWKDIRSADGKRCFLVSRSMLRTLLGTAIDCPPEEIIINAGAQGKPFVERPTTRWQFNLSHSRGLIFLALAYDTAVGVDVEYCQRKTDCLELARHFFHPREIQQLEALPADEQRQHFFRLWTLKEAYIKAVGSGLSHGLDNFGFIIQQENSGLTMHPSPQSVINCWSTQPEPEYTLASIALSQKTETVTLKLYDYLPQHHCNLRQLDNLVHNTIFPGSADPHCDKK